MHLSVWLMPETIKEMCKYNLTENYSGMTAMIFGEIYRYNGEWKFNAVGNGTTDPGLGNSARDLCENKKEELLWFLFLYKNPVTVCP